LQRRFSPKTKSSGDRSCEPLAETSRSDRTADTSAIRPSCLPLVLLPITLQLLRCAAPRFRRSRADRDSTTAAPSLSRQTKNRCNDYSFASAQRGPLYSLVWFHPPTARAKRHCWNIIDS